MPVSKDKPEDTKPPEDDKSPEEPSGTSLEDVVEALARNANPTGHGFDPEASTVITSWLAERDEQREGGKS